MHEIFLSQFKKSYNQIRFFPKSYVPKYSTFFYVSDQVNQKDRANKCNGRIQIADFNFLKLIKYHNWKNFTHEKGDDRC